MSVAAAFSRKERLKPQANPCFMSITIHSGLKTKILEAQSEASKDLKASAEWLRGLGEDTILKQQDAGEIYFFDRIWIPSVGGKRSEKMVQLGTRLMTARIVASTKLSDKRRKPLKLQVETVVLLFKVISLRKECTIWSRKGKLAPRYVGPFEIVGMLDRWLIAEVTPGAELCPRHVSCVEPQGLFQLSQMFISGIVKKLMRRRIPISTFVGNTRQGAEYTWECGRPIPEAISNLLLTNPVSFLQVLQPEP
ncbi:hypothetical protein Tco_1228293 [Tanacetum coccineum]